MSAQIAFELRGRNSDVLTCIANLSNDEVFTSPDFANRMLDTVATVPGNGVVCHGTGIAKFQPVRSHGTR